MVSKISQGGYGTVYRGVLAPRPPNTPCECISGAESRSSTGSVPSSPHAPGRCKGLAKASRQVCDEDMKGERRVQLYELLKEACVERQEAPSSTGVPR